MTLAQLADFICTKVNQTEAEDLAACKDFLKRRHEMLWHEALWKDSLVQYTQTLSPDGYTVSSTWLPDKGVLLCPTIIDRVLAARIADRKLNVQRPEYYYRIDYDSFSKTGNATEFVLLPPCVWEWESAQTVGLTPANAADADQELVCDLLSADNIGVDRSSITLQPETVAAGSTERVDSISKLATSGAVMISVGTVQNIIPDGTAYFSPVITPSAYSYTLSGLVAGQTYGFYAGNAVRLRNSSFQTVLTTSGTFVADGNDYYLSGPTYSDALPAPTVAITAQVYTAGTTVSTMAAAALGATKRQRIRLMEIPADDVTIRVLGKRVCPTFSDDNDVPGINGVDNCLLAFAQADMLQRERQYGKAQAVQQEAGALLDQLKTLEMVQQAHNVSIQPGQGFVSEYQFNSGAYSPLTF